MAERLLAVAQRAYTALLDGDLDAFLTTVDPDVEFTSLIAEAEGQTFRGHEGVRSWWQEVVGSLGGLRLEPEEFREIGDAVLVHLEARGTVSGLPIAQTIWQAIHVRDGKAVWWAGFRTEEEALRAIEARTA